MHNDKIFGWDLRQFAQNLRKLDFPATYLCTSCLRSLRVSFQCDQQKQISAK